MMGDGEGRVGVEVAPEQFGDDMVARLVKAQAAVPESEAPADTGVRSLVDEVTRRMDALDRVDAGHGETVRELRGRVAELEGKHNKLAGWAEGQVDQVGELRRLVNGVSARVHAVDQGLGTVVDETGSRLDAQRQALAELRNRLGHLAGVDERVAEVAEGFCGLEEGVRSLLDADLPAQVDTLRRVVREGLGHALGHMGEGQAEVPHFPGPDGDPDVDDGTADLVESLRRLAVRLSDNGEPSNVVLAAAGHLEGLVRERAEWGEALAQHGQDNEQLEAERDEARALAHQVAAERDRYRETALAAERLVRTLQDTKADHERRLVNAGKRVAQLERAVHDLRCNREAQDGHLHRVVELMVGGEFHQALTVLVANLVFGDDEAKHNEMAEALDRLAAGHPDTVKLAERLEATQAMRDVLAEQAVGAQARVEQALQRERTERRSREMVETQRDTALARVASLRTQLDERDERERALTVALEAARLDAEQMRGALTEANVVANARPEPNPLQVMAQRAHDAGELVRIDRAGHQPVTVLVDHVRDDGMTVFAGKVGADGTRVGGSWFIHYSGIDTMEMAGTAVTQAPPAAADPYTFGHGGEG